jgi:hypothetical protein
LTGAFGQRLQAACLANNHIMDCGGQGLQDTMDLLDAKGIGWFGAGLQRKSVRNPITLDLEETRIGMAGYVCPTSTPVFAGADSGGVVPIELAIIERDLRAARSSGATRLVVCLHWGVEEVGYPRPQDIELAHRIVDLGADLVVGHHAHCPQPVEVYNGKHIFYGLGNAIMPDLDLPAYYDAAGAPTTRYRKKQAGWNRRSLAVEYAPSDGHVKSRRLTFEGLTLREARFGGPCRRLRGADRDGQARHFRRAVFWYHARMLFLGYLAHPRPPRLRHLRRLRSLLAPEV